MKPRTLMVVTLVIGLMLPAAGASFAAGSTDQPASEKLSEPPPSNVVLQFERMTDPRTQQRLFYRVHEVASLAGLPKDKILCSIQEGKLCVITVDGVPFIPANFAQGYLEKAASVAVHAAERQSREE